MKIIHDKLNVAIYCRLSREDGDNQESSSIKTQKDILTEYAKANNWNIYKYYIDDGYSGGNFNRPAFKDLINDIEDNKINVLLTKDLSRLGRNYIEAGYYTEEYFPSKNVRYIAVNDNYDSIKEDNDLTPFKNIINQWYLKDLSKKIKSSHINRMKKGVLPRGNKIPKYGYLHTENNERIINLETAPTVKKIFELYNKGYGYKTILKYLYEKKIKVPSYYMYEKYNYNPTFWIDKKEDAKYSWTQKMITRILIDNQYTGALELGRNPSINYKTHKRVEVPKEKQYIYEDRFPAIITKEEYEKATNLRKSRIRNTAPLEENIYKNIIICSECGNPLPYFHFKNKVKYNRRIYKCQRRKCTCRTEIPIDMVTSFVKIEIPNFINKLLNYEDKLREYAKTYSKTKRVVDTNNDELIKKLKQRNMKLDILIEKLFEKSITYDIPTETYKRMMNSYKNEFNENKNKIKTLEESFKNYKTKDYVKQLDDFINQIKEYKNVSVDRKLLLALVDSMIFKRSKSNSRELHVKITYKKIPELFEGFFNENK